MIQHRLLALGCLPLLLGACSDDELSAAAFEQQYPDAYCDFVFRCCGGGERSFGSKGQCLQAVGNQVSALLAFKDDAIAHAGFAGGAAQGCLDALAGDCGAASKRASCLEEVTRPALSVGGDCRHNAECDSYYCVISKTTGTGSCGDKSTPGGGCNGDDRACPDGYYCSSGNVCSAKKDTADTCAAGSHCKSGVCSAADKICIAPDAPLCDGR